MTLSRREAAEILGVRADSTQREVKAAYRCRKTQPHSLPERVARQKTCTHSRHIRRGLPLNLSLPHRRRLAIRWHPDKNAGDEEAKVKFQQINAAYEHMCVEHGIICSFYAHEDWMYAAEEGDIDEIKSLLDAEVDVMMVDRWGFTALHKASQRGHGAIVVELLAHDKGKELVRSRIKLGGATALHLACEKGPSRLFVVEELLKCCSDKEFIDIADRNTCKTAMQIAVGRLESARKYGGDDAEQEQRLVDLLARYGAE